MRAYKSSKLSWSAPALFANRLSNSLGEFDQYDRPHSRTRACIRQVLAVNRKNAHLIPTWQDLEAFESMKAALGQLDDFTDMLFGEQKVTVSVIKPILHNIRKNL